MGTNTGFPSFCPRHRPLLGSFRVFPAARTTRRRAESSPADRMLSRELPLQDTAPRAQEVAGCYHPGASTAAWLGPRSSHPSHSFPVSAQCPVSPESHQLHCVTFGPETPFCLGGWESTSCRPEPSLIQGGMVIEVVKAKK